MTEHDEYDPLCVCGRCAAFGLLPEIRPLQEIIATIIHSRYTPLREFPSTLPLSDRKFLAGLGISS